MATVLGRGSNEVHDQDIDRQIHECDTSMLSMDVIAASHLADGALRILTPHQRAEACRQLTHVRLDDLQLQTLDAGVLQQLTSCRSLYLQHNKLTNVEALYALPNLTFLVLSHNLLQQVAGLHGLSALLFLDISHNFLQQLAFAELPSSIKYIKVAGNPCTESAEFAKELLSYLPKIQEVDGESVKNHQSACTAAKAANSFEAAAAVQPGASAAAEADDNTRDTDMPGYISSWLVALKHLDRAYTSRIAPAAQHKRSNSDDSGVSKQQQSVLNTTTTATNTGTTNGLSSWVPDSNCKRQLACRGLYGSSQQQQLVAEISTRSVGQLIGEHSTTGTLQCSIRSFSAPVHASATPAAAVCSKSSASSKCSNKQLFSTDETQQQCARIGQARKVGAPPRLLNRPRSIQAGAVVPVQARLQGQRLAAAATGLGNCHAQQTAAAAIDDTVQEEESSTPPSGQGHAIMQHTAAAETSCCHKADDCSRSPTGECVHDTSSQECSKVIVPTTSAAGNKEMQTPVSADILIQTEATLIDSNAKVSAGAAISRHRRSKLVVNAGSQAGASRQPLSPQKLASGIQPAYTTPGCSNRCRKVTNIRKTAGTDESDVTSTAGGSSGKAVRAASGPPRRLPALTHSTAAAAPEAACLDQPVAAVLLQHEADLCTAGNKAKLAPIDHPAVQSCNRTIVSAGRHHDSQDVLLDVMSAVQNEAWPALPEASRASCGNNPGVHCTLGTRQLCIQSDTVCFAEMPSSLVQHQTKPQLLATSSHVMATQHDQRIVTNELSRESLKGSLVQDRCHGLQGCGIDNSGTQGYLAAEPDSSTTAGSKVGQWESPVHNLSGAAMLDVLEANSKTSLGSTLAAMQDRHKQRTCLFLQQQKQIVASEKQQVERLLCQLKKRTAVLKASHSRCSSPSTDSHEQLLAATEQQQQQPCQLQQSSQLNIMPCKHTFITHQDPTGLDQTSSLVKPDDGASSGCEHTYAAVQILSAALKQIRHLPNSSDSTATDKHSLAASSTSSLRQDITPGGDVVNMIAKLKLKLCAAAQDLEEVADRAAQGTTVAKKMNATAAPANGTCHITPACSSPSSRHDMQCADNEQKAPFTADVKELPSSEHEGTDAGFDSSDGGIDVELQAMLDRMFEHTLPPSGCHYDLGADLTSRTSSGDSKDYNIPAALCNSSMPL